MELKSRINDLLNSELEILAYEQKKLNEYKLTPEPALKAIEIRQRIINKRLELFNELQNCVDLTDQYFNKTVNLIVDGAAKGYYLSDKWKQLLNDAICNELKKLATKNKISEACCNSFLSSKLFK